MSNDFQSESLCSVPEEYPQARTSRTSRLEPNNKLNLKMDGKDNQIILGIKAYPKKQSKFIQRAKSIGNSDDILNVLHPTGGHKNNYYSSNKNDYFKKKQ